MPTTRRSPREARSLDQEPEAGAAREVEREPYRAPRITGRKALARATLFSGTGPDAGGVVG